MHLYSNSLSAMKTFSSVHMLEKLPACISHSDFFNLSQISLGMEDENLVFFPLVFMRMFSFLETLQ